MASAMQAEGLLTPLRVPVFRRIRSASLRSNFGILIQGVGTAWSMSRLIDDATMVALVQTALMLPIMLIALPEDALSDMFDRRLVCIAALFFALVGAFVANAVCYFLPSGRCGFRPGGASRSGPSGQVSQSTDAGLPSAAVKPGCCPIGVCPDRGQSYATGSTGPVAAPSVADAV